MAHFSFRPNTPYMPRVSKPADVTRWTVSLPKTLPLQGPTATQVTVRTTPGTVCMLLACILGEKGGDLDGNG